LKDILSYLLFGEGIFVRWFFRKAENMRNLPFIILFLVTLFSLSACKNIPTDQTGPLISDIQTSGNVLVISDCSGASVDISAKVADPSGMGKVLLWYRTGTDKQFLSTDMELKEGVYIVSLNGPDFWPARTEPLNSISLPRTRWET
jgi:hypothetical protein